MAADATYGPTRPCEARRQRRLAVPWSAHGDLLDPAAGQPRRKPPPLVALQQQILALHNAATPQPLFGVLEPACQVTAGQPQLLYAGHFLAAVPFAFVTDHRTTRRRP